MLAEQRAVGVVVAPLGADPDRLTRLRQRGIPLVLTDRTMPAQDGCSVAVDDVSGGCLAVDHLLNDGARHILVVNGSRTIRQCADRYQGARKAIRSSPDARLEQVVAETMTIEAGAAIARGLNSVPDAVFCTNDFLAVGVCQGLSARGLSIPDDIRVIGYGDLDVATLAAVPLTTIHQPVEDLGRAAIDLLIDEIEASDEHVHETRVFPPRLVVRGSTCG